MNSCIVCDNVIEESFNSLFCDEVRVCYECFSKLKTRNEKFFIDGVEGIILYWYDDYFKDALYKYKGCGDYLLKDFFLAHQSQQIRKRYKGYSIVLAPSNLDKELKRGFNHLEEIFKSIGIPIIKCARKTKNWKQSDKSLEERRSIQKIIKIDKSCLKGVKRVLIVDDVMTSGSTIRAIVSQIPSSIDKKILVLSSNCRF